MPPESENKKHKTKNLGTVTDQSLEYLYIINVPFLHLGVVNTLWYPRYELSSVVDLLRELSSWACVLEHLVLWWHTQAGPLWKKGVAGLGGFKGGSLALLPARALCFLATPQSKQLPLPFAEVKSSATTLPSLA